jgi:5-methylcytosine-specific restriction endonuclease McrA
MLFLDACQAVMETRDHNCAFCGHPVPKLLLRNFHKRQPGRDDLDNIIIACDSCIPKKFSTIIEMEELGA